MENKIYGHPDPEEFETEITPDIDEEPTLPGEDDELDNE